MGEFILTAVKFVLAVVLLPLLWACAILIQDQLRLYPAGYDEFFLWGVLGFLLVYLFIHQFRGTYEFGQKIIGAVFKFTSPFDRLLTSILPFYLTVILLFFYAVTAFLGIDTYDHYFMFFTGFAFTMHILLAAQDLQEQEQGPAKPGYFLTMSLVFIFNVFFLVLLLDLAAGELTFPKFFMTVVKEAKSVYVLVFEKFFLMK